MGVISRKVFSEIASSAFLGTLLFTFVLFFRNFSNRLFELLVRSAAPPETVAYLFSLVLPPVLTFTVPAGVLVGILMTLSRMSGDAEIIAMRAAGIPSRRVLWPVVSFSLMAVLA